VGDLLRIRLFVNFSGLDFFEAGRRAKISYFQEVMVRLLVVSVSVHSLSFESLVGILQTEPLVPVAGRLYLVFGSLFALISFSRLL
jgi:hypothetical protein